MLSALDYPMDHLSFARSITMKSLCSQNLNGRLEATMTTVTILYPLASIL
jgi:hypothetical protein